MLHDAPEQDPTQFAAISLEIMLQAPLLDQDLGWGGDDDNGSRGPVDPLPNAPEIIENRAHGADREGDRHPSKTPTTNTLAR